MNRAVDVFDEIRARHEGRIMRWRELPPPEPRTLPVCKWWQIRKRRQCDQARRYHACMLAGWWEAEHEILFGARHAA